MALFATTILTTVFFHNFLHLPPFLGMRTGLAYLQSLVTTRANRADRQPRTRKLLAI
jgi:hypothetical protein